jgi:methyl-accepting chemotaxis protein
MKLINNFKFRTKIIFGVYTNIAIALCASVVAVVFMGNVSTNSKILTLSDDLVQTVLTAGNDRRDLISTGQLEYGSKVLSAVDQGIGILNEIRDIASSKAIDSTAEEMTAVLRDYRPAMETLIEIKNNVTSSMNQWTAKGSKFTAILNDLKLATEDNSDTTVIVDELETRIYLMRIAAIYFMNEQTEAAYQSFTATINDINATLSTLQPVVSGNSSIKQIVDSFSSSFNDYKQLGSAYYQALQQQSAQLDELGVLAQKLNGSIEKSSAYYGGAALLSATANDDFAAAENMQRTLQIIIAAAGILMGVVVCNILIASTSKPLGGIVKMCDVLATGDLNSNYAMDVNRRDEIGDLSRSFNNIIESQKEMATRFEKMADGDLTVTFKPRSSKDTMGVAFVKMVKDMHVLMSRLTATARGLTEASAQLAKTSEQAGHATQQIASTSQQVARGASDQSSSLQETTAAINQLSKAIEQISRGAQEQSRGIEKTLNTVKKVVEASNKATDEAAQASNISSQSAEVAKNGAVMAKQTVEGMEKIRNAIGFTSEKITKLGEQSGEIDKIVATIDDIAAQTNLLALNAAIEAARAGEQGRGFAVVADEVRKLAERSLRATKEIADLIIGIQTGVNDAVKAMQDSISYVENGYKLASDCGNAMSEIIKYAENVGYDVTRISAATVGLSKLGDELLKVTEEISSVVEENTAATEQMAASSDQVSKSIESVAGVAEENGAATEQVSASAEEMSAQVEEVVASAQALSSMADELSTAVSVFKLSIN